jgi:hypothetical protein
MESAFGFQVPAVLDRADEQPETNPAIKQAGMKYIPGMIAFIGIRLRHSASRMLSQL